MDTRRFFSHHIETSALSDAIKQGVRSREEDCVKSLIPEATPFDADRAIIHGLSRQLAESVREQRNDFGSIERFLNEYGLDNDEGVLLMCLAEALLRIPDAETSQRFIQDKLASGHWERHIGNSQSFWVNASTWGLLLTGKMVTSAEHGSFRDFSVVQNAFKQLLAKVGEPILQRALGQAMTIIGQQFVAGTTIEHAFKSLRKSYELGYLYSFDMLGEAAMTEADAKRYHNSYALALEQCATVGEAQGKTLQGRASLSIKLSALHPRFEARQKKALDQLYTRVIDLVYLAIEKGIPVTLDAEESYRLESTLNVFYRLLKDNRVSEWGQLGLAVQAYQKRAVHVIDWLADLSLEKRCVIPVRLVKGAYWDTEIKHAQQHVHDDYPVFTRKAHTDVSYLACARRMLAAEGGIRPQFATHNAHTVASILTMRKHYPSQTIEMQRLHGMGESLYTHVMNHIDDVQCRIYAPVGDYKELLPYLVRRLLENGANSSFVNHINDPNVDIESLIREPTDNVTTDWFVPLPKDIVNEPTVSHKKATSIDFNHEHDLKSTLTSLHHHLQTTWHAKPLSGHKVEAHKERVLCNPAKQAHTIGRVSEATVKGCTAMLDSAVAGFESWRQTDAEQRAELLDESAKLFEQHRLELLAMCIMDAGKTFDNAMAEVQEAIDYLRYYAQQCRSLFSSSTECRGVVGEHNTLQWEGRGVFLCIAPWNFPLAIFIGQTAAALAAGNTVIAKPARQTPVIAYHAVRLMLKAGIPENVLHFLPCGGDVVHDGLLHDSRIAGCAFTGSNATAKIISQALAKRPGSIPAFIAETGGINAMLVDSTALPEQVARDVVRSAFDSAGQRCSSLRVLYLQNEIADTIIELIKGYMDTLVIDNPLHPHCDIGPVIDAQARDRLQEHIDFLKKEAIFVHQCALSDRIKDEGFFIAPCVFEIENISVLKEETFGPVLHIVRYAPEQLDEVVDDINLTGYGLTLGLHSRIDSRTQDIAKRVRVGNVYINRDMIGATVGAQPFGGRGLSGTGPKAGGPNYLTRFACEKTISVNTAAIGGSVELYR